MLGKFKTCVKTVLFCHAMWHPCIRCGGS